MRTGEKSAPKLNILYGTLLHLRGGFVIHTPNILHHLIHRSASTSKCLVAELL